MALRIPRYNQEDPVNVVTPAKPIQPNSRAFLPSYDVQPTPKPIYKASAGMRYLQGLALRARLKQERRLRRKIRMQQFKATLAMWMKITTIALSVGMTLVIQLKGLDWVMSQTEYYMTLLTSLIS